MATSTTSTGKTIEQYIKDTLGSASAAGEAALAAGYPPESLFTQAYYEGVPSLYMYGDPAQADALARASSLFGAYGQAGGYDKTNFADIENLYKGASGYNQTGYGDIANLYKAAGQYNKTGYGDIANLYRAAGDYQKTGYEDLAAKYAAAGTFAPTQYGDIASAYGGVSYGPRDYEDADYTAKNIKERMSPYEELVADRQRARLKKAYDEARGEREAQAIRQGAYGGSGQAIQEELARRQYLEQMADMDAQSLQSAFESGANLYSREIADRLAAGQAEEASQQYAKQLQMAVISGQMSAKEAEQKSREFAQQARMAGLEGEMAARGATAAEIAAAKQAQFASLQGLMGTREQEAAQTAAAKQAELAGIAGLLDTRNMTAAQVAAAKEAELAGIAGMLGTRQQTAAQTAAAKEAEFAGLAGQQEAARQQALMAEQQKNMQLTNIAAAQAAGQQQEQRALGQAQYGLDIASQQAGMLAPLSGGVTAVPTTQQKTSTGQNILGGLSTAAGIVQGLGGVSGIANTVKGLFGAGGGLVPDGLQRGYYYRGGGLADLEPEYYSYYER